MGTGAEERYTDPGFPITRMTATGDFAIQRTGDWIYLAGAGASPQGDRPFLDRLNVATQETERLWRGDPPPSEAAGAPPRGAGPRGGGPRAAPPRAPPPSPRAPPARPLAPLP